MAEPWIKVRKGLFGDGRVRVLSAKCPAPIGQVVGALVQLWCLADDYADENGVLFGYTKNDIDDILGIKNFCGHMPSDWIDLSKEWVKLPDYQRHNGSTAKRRAQDSRRKNLSRKSPQPVRNVSATDADKKRTRREEKRGDIYNPPLKDLSPLDNIEKSKPAAKFIKPSVTDLQNHIAEKNLIVDAGIFFNHYESNGWLVGKNPMKNWKAALQTWHGKNSNGANGNGKHTPARSKNFTAGDNIKTADVIKRLEQDESTCIES